MNLNPPPADTDRSVAAGQTKPRHCHVGFDTTSPLRGSPGLFETRCSVDPAYMTGV